MQGCNSPITAVEIQVFSRSKTKVDAETREFLSEELRSEMESLARALRWSEIHAQQLGLVELNTRLSRMSEEFKSAFDLILTVKD